MNNSLSINRSAARIPDAIDPHDLTLNERSQTAPNQTLPNQEDVVSSLERLPIDNPPQSNIGLSNGVGIAHHNIQVNLSGEPNGVPVVIVQPRRDQPISQIVLTNNQLSERPQARLDDSYDNFKTSCREYWQCVKTDDRSVQRARCVTFHGGSVGMTLASGGLYGAGLCVLYCCVLFCSAGGNHGPGKNPCSPKTFSRSCLPDC